MVKYWRGQEAVLSVSGGSLGSDPIGVLQEVSVAPDRDSGELRGAGDTSFVDAMETARAFDVTGEVLAWTLDSWDRFVEWDEAASETDTSADMERFDATVTLNSADGSTKEVGFVDGYFQTLPEISGGREEWVGMSIELRFADIDSISNTDATA